jgi:DNA polymerase I
VYEGKVAVEKLVISRTCKDYSDYKDPDSLAHVQTAKKLVQMGYEFIPGMKVSWIVTDAKTTPQQVEPFVRGREFTAKPDYEYYASRVASTIARVTEVFGVYESDLTPWLEKERLAKPKIGKKVKQKAPVKKGVTLDDFM